MSVASRAIFSNFFEEQSTQNHPQYLSGLSRALFPTTFLEIAVYVRREEQYVQTLELLLLLLFFSFLKSFSTYWLKIEPALLSHLALTFCHPSFEGVLNATIALPNNLTSFVLWKPESLVKNKDEINTYLNRGQNVPKMCV